MDNDGWVAIYRVRLLPNVSRRLFNLSQMAVINLLVSSLRFFLFVWLNTHIYEFMVILIFDS